MLGPPVGAESRRSRLSYAQAKLAHVVKSIRRKDQLEICALSPNLIRRPYFFDNRNEGAAPYP